ncbi:MAG: winged helix-turn-helix transcriptional regulator [Muribaculaceae bacterium]|nr:winged helix-turn-helix transcriptional regulator [Muribaculaceae bacterium]
MPNTAWASQKKLKNSQFCCILKTLQKSITIDVPDKVLNKVSDKVPNKVPNKVSDKVPNKSEAAILRLLSADSRMTRIQLAEQAGISESGVKKIIANMKAAGWLVRRGSNKNGYWEVVR